MKAGVVGVVIVARGKIYVKNFHRRVEFRFDLCSYGVEFGCGARYQEGAVAGSREVEREFTADAVGGAGYDGPGFGRGPEVAELDCGNQSMTWGSIEGGQIGTGMGVLVCPAERTGL